MKALMRRMRRLRPGQILTLGFFAVILTGTLLLMLPFATVEGESVGFLEALFTATSAVCVTGLTVVNTGLVYSLFGQSVILGLIQIGGLGFMTVAALVFLMLGRRISLRERVLIQESFNADSLQGLVRLVKQAVAVTFVVEGMAAIVLSLRLIPQYGFGRGLFNSVFLSVSAFCNAGFDPFGFDNSITPLVADPVVNIVLMLLITTGGMGFAVVMDLLHCRRLSKLTLHSRVVLWMTAALFLTGSVGTLLTEWSNPATLGALPPTGRVMAAAFQSVTLRTAGFDTIGQGGLTAGGQLLSVMLMFVGAAPASTGGGVKTTTLFMVLLSVYVSVRGGQDYNVGRRRLNEQAVRRALAVFSLGLGLLLTGTLLIAAAENAAGSPLPLGAVLFETTSALSTTGLSMGITAGLHAFSKVLLILFMFLGRVGPLTVSMALSGGASGRPDAVRYPEDRLMVG